MATIDEKFSEQFYRWENRGRGTQVFAEPVWPEPPFRPFNGHYLPLVAAIDDGRRPSFLGSLVERWTQKAAPPPPAPPPSSPEDDEPKPELLYRDPLVELQTFLPAKLDISKDTFEQFLANLSQCREPIAFELVGVPNRVIAQFAGHPDDAPLLRRQLQAYFPEVLFQKREGTLENSWRESSAQEEFAVEFGLEREFVFPLASGKIDPFIGVIGALSELQVTEVALFQVLFSPANHPWSESIITSVTGSDGKPFFVNASELTEAARSKVARPLFAAVVRIAIKAGGHERTLQLAHDLAASLRVFAHPRGNALIPLHNHAYPSFEDHIEDVLFRQTRRSGMLLNSDELIGFVHFPSSTVRSGVLERDCGKTKAAPTSVRHSEGLLLGDNLHAGESIEVRLAPDQRVQHTHIVGASGTGKSTLLFNLIRQDIENGDGVAVLDPHGDLIDRILGIIPESRTDDVVLIDPSDADFPVGFNILSAHSEQEKILLASDLVSVFRRLSSSWGDQMDIVLKNAILVVLESPTGGTLPDIRRFLIEPAFRAEFLKTVSDPELIYYWQKVFPQLTGNRSVGPVLTRLQEFMSLKPIRNMVSQSENKLDFANIMDTKKIFLARLPEGLCGKENSYLLGTLLISKFQQIAMSRQAQALSARTDYWLYIDEFDHFITPTMAEILKGARKYRLGLTLAHQELHQLKADANVESAVATHPYTRIVFRVNDDDAKRLVENFSSFQAESFKNLPKFHAIARAEQSDCDFNLIIRPFQKLDDAQCERRRQEVKTASREKYARPRLEVEAALRAALEAATTEAVQRQLRPVVSPVPNIAETKPPSIPSQVPKPAFPPQQPASVVPVVDLQASKSDHKREVSPNLGRGGIQHRAIQKRLKDAAELLGFKGNIEAEVLDGKGNVDVLLTRELDDLAIACEIAITRTIDEEVGNIAKCLKAGFMKIAVIAVDRDRLRKLSAGVSASFGEQMSTRVKYYLPDELIEELRAMPVPAPPLSVRIRHGYKVIRSSSQLTSEERKRKDDETLNVAMEAIQRPQKKRQP